MKPTINPDIAQQQNRPPQSWKDSDRPAELDELNFDDDDYHARAGEPLEPTDVEHWRAGERAQEAGLTGAATPDGDVTSDELTPENLMPEDGSRSPREAGGDEPAEWQLTEKFDVGGGHGLDEAELARLDPLDKKPWDGDPDTPLTQFAETDEEGFSSGESDPENLYTNEDEDDIETE